MKMFKRLAAVLLAGVMSLSVLTACGGGKTNEQKVEDAYLTVFSSAFGLEDLKNDDALKTLAKNYLDKSVAEDGSLTNAPFMSPNQVEDDWVADKDGNVTMVVIPSSDKAATSLDEADLNQLDDQDALKAAGEALKQSMNITPEMTAQLKTYIKGVGVASVKKGDKYYIAFAVKMSEDALKSGDNTITSNN